MKFLSLNFCPPLQFSAALQLSTQKIIQEAAKFTNPRKFSPSKILGYTIYWENCHYKENCYTIQVCYVLLYRDL